MDQILYRNGAALESDRIAHTDPQDETRRAAIVRRAVQVVRPVEQRIAEFVRPYSLTLLRLSLGTVFIWFGALKVAHATPVADLVAATVPWLDRTWFVPLLGAVEVLLGIGLIAGRHLTIVGSVLVAHLAGTFLVLLMQPQIAFQHGNPLLLTTVGEFVIKNVVLISASVVVTARLTHPNPRPPTRQRQRHDQHGSCRRTRPSPRCTRAGPRRSCGSARSRMTAPFTHDAL